MQTNTLIALAASFLASTTATAALVPRATSTPVALGSVQFGTPFCGDAKEQNINTNNCTTAVSQLLAAHCTNGLCTVPPAAPLSEESALELTVGACEIIIGVFVGGSAATFAEASVQAEFPGFIGECVLPSQPSDNGNPIVRSTDGRMSLLFSNGLPVGPE